MADRDYSYDLVGSGAPVNQQAHRMEEGQLWRQYIIAGVANIAVLSTGFSMGWTSSAIPKFLDEETPLLEPITSSQISWIVSLFTIGAIFGPFLAGFLAKRIGRKWTFLSSSVLLLIGWILVAVARSVAIICAGRIALGVGAGMLFTVSPMYCAEIATDNSRGALGSFLQVFVTVGFLISYAVGAYASYSGIAYLGIALVCTFAATFFFMPDSPIYYLTKNDKEAAARCLMTLRGRTRAGVEDELFKMEADVKVSMEKTATLLDVFRGSNFKAFYISCALVFFQQCSGVNAVLSYLYTIFGTSGSSLHPSTASIIVGAVQVLASLMTSFLVDRLGRRILLLISTAGTSLALGIFGFYFFQNETSSAEAMHYSFLPLISLMLFIITYCWGLGPLPFTMMSELFPVEVKTAAVPIATAFSWVLTFVVTKSFVPILYSVGMYTAFWIFAVCCALGFFFTLLVVPETKGKSFNEIQDMLAGRPQHKFNEEKSEKV